ncbi:hypothetical protein [Comamonas sp. B-9]|uniref:hypothetical protein n=1 Tax=Comamonas sp. B-9 TaxID=1055192 RepID=UPI000395D5B5|nr:hypothetical protein [Comamonas sp. B-9]
MSLNQYGMPSRVPAIAEIGRLLAEQQLSAAEQQRALDLLVQDHADLDEVESQAALWAIAQLGRSEAACAALLACADTWLHSAELASSFLDGYTQVCGNRIVPAAAPAFAQLQQLAQYDAELAARLPLFEKAP